MDMTINVLTRAHRPNSVCCSGTLVRMEPSYSRGDSVTTLDGEGWSVPVVWLKPGRGCCPVLGVILDSLSNSYATYVLDLSWTCIYVANCTLFIFPPVRLADTASGLSSLGQLRSVAPTVTARAPVHLRFRSPVLLARSEHVSARSGVHTTRYTNND